MDIVTIAIAKKLAGGGDITPERIEGALAELTVLNETDIATIEQIEQKLGLE